MRPIAALMTSGLAVAMLAGCAQTQSRSLEYPVQPPPLTEREQQDVDALVKNFSSIEASKKDLPKNGEMDVLDEAQKRRLKEAREPFTFGEPGSPELNMLQEEQDRRLRERHEEREQTSEYSRGEINAIKRRVARKYDSRHDIRHELRSKYGL